MHSGRLATSGKRPVVRRRPAHADGRTPPRRPPASPKRPLAARSSLRRKLPCRGHPLDQGKSDQTLAGILARGSSLDARPSQASQDLASGPVTCPNLPVRWGDVHRARRLQLQGQPWLGEADASFTMFPFKPLSRHRRDHFPRGCPGEWAIAEVGGVGKGGDGRVEWVEWGNITPSPLQGRGLGRGERPRLLAVGPPPPAEGGGHTPQRGGGGAPPPPPPPASVACSPLSRRRFARHPLP